MKERCLLDMDGVLVDFVGGACRLHGVPNPYDDRKNWGVYGVEGLVGLTAEQFFGPMGEAFWANLDPLPYCFDIVRLVEEAFGKDGVAICTQPILTAGCAEGKIRWLRKHLPQFARRFLIGPVKQFAASEHAWLVDDSDNNIAKFRVWGGNAVLVPAPWNTSHKTCDVLMPYLEHELSPKNLLFSRRTPVHANL